MNAAQAIPEPVGDGELGLGGWLASAGRDAVDGLPIEITDGYWVLPGSIAYEGRVALDAVTEDVMHHPAPAGSGRNVPRVSWVAALDIPVAPHTGTGARRSHP